MTHIAKTLAGRTLTYHNYAALTRARKRRRDVIVDSWPENDPPPFGASSADEWDHYRTRHGYSGTRS